MEFGVSYSIEWHFLDLVLLTWTWWLKRINPLINVLLFNLADHFIIEHFTFANRRMLDEKFQLALQSLRKVDEQIFVCTLLHVKAKAFIAGLTSIL